MLKTNTLVNFETWQGNKLTGIIKEIFSYNNEEYARIETGCNIESNIKEFTVKTERIKENLKA